MSEEAIEAAPDAGGRAGEVLNKLERVYLAAIRAVALAAATLLIVYAAWLAISGAYKSSKDIDTVKEAPASVSPQDVTRIDVRRLAKPTEGDGADPFSSQKGYYSDFARRYFILFRTKFEPYRQAEDKSLDQKSFDARFVRTVERIDGVRAGTVDFEHDKADLESLLAVMTKAAADKSTLDRLRAYKGAKRIKISRTVTDTRRERYCSYYGYYLDECLIYDTRTVPVRRTVQETKLPEGVITHAALFHAYQDRYFSLLSERRRANAATAEQERFAIIADNLDGSARLWTAIKFLGGFVVLMFLFLLIALERHQRKIAAGLRP